MIQQNLEVIQPIVEDGLLIDPETGEVVGLVNKVFTIQTEADANWALEKLVSLEADVAAINQTPAVIAARAILAHAEELRAKRQKRVDWFRLRFTAELGAFASKQLTGKKERTWSTVFGSISLRIKKGGLRVKDKEAAVVAAKDMYAHAVVTKEEFQISKLTPEQKQGIIDFLAIADPTDKEALAFEVEADSETVTIETGVPK